MSNVNLHCSIIGGTIHFAQAFALWILFVIVVWMVKPIGGITGRVGRTVVQVAISGVAAQLYHRMPRRRIESADQLKRSHRGSLDSRTAMGATIPVRWTMPWTMPWTMYIHY